MIPTAAAENHAAVVAWVEGGMNPAQRQEFEAHLASCAECQALAAVLLHPPVPQPEPVAPAAAEPERSAFTSGIGRTVLIVLGAVVVLLAGYGLGFWAWHLTHR